MILPVICSIVGHIDTANADRRLSALGSNALVDRPMMDLCSMHQEMVA
jgi:hypothetical protein